MNDEIKVPDAVKLNDDMAAREIEAQRDIINQLVKENNDLRRLLTYINVCLPVKQKIMEYFPDEQRELYNDVLSRR